MKPSLSVGFRRHLALQLIETAPFGPRLKKSLLAIDLYEEDGEETALELLDSVEFSNALLAKVKKLESLDFERVGLVRSQVDGEEDPFVPESLEELKALPNLEVLNWATAMPKPPLDVTPLLALKKLRHVELWAEDYVQQKSRRALLKNTRAAQQLEAAGFTRQPDSTGRLVFVRK